MILTEPTPYGGGGSRNLEKYFSGCTSRKIIKGAASLLDATGLQEGVPHDAYAL